jgi:hypothetical protein
VSSFRSGRVRTWVSRPLADLLTAGSATLTQQAWAAWGFGLAGLTLISGHLMNTGTVDFALWAAVLVRIAIDCAASNPTSTTSCSAAAAVGDLAYVPGTGALSRVVS